MDLIKDMHKFIKLTGERARLDAKANGTYIVYKSNRGQIVKEFINGEIVVINDQEATHE